MFWRTGLWSQRQGGSSMCISCCFLLHGARHWQLLLHLFAPQFVLGSAGNLLTRLLLGGERRLEAAAPSADSGWERNAQPRAKPQAWSPGRTWSPAGTCAFRHRCVCTSGGEQSCAHLLLSSCTWPCCVLLPMGRNPSAGIAALVNVQRSSFALHQKQMNKH